jgi:hypothetical protein
MEREDARMRKMHPPVSSTELRTFKGRVGVAVRAQGEGLPLGALRISCVCDRR